MTVSVGLPEFVSNIWVAVPLYLLVSRILVISRYASPSPPVVWVPFLPSLPEWIWGKLECPGVWGTSSKFEVLLKSRLWGRIISSRKNIPRLNDNYTQQCWADYGNCDLYLPSLRSEICNRNYKNPTSFSGNNSLHLTISLWFPRLFLKAELVVVGVIMIFLAGH